MAYDRQKIYKKALRIAEIKKLTFIEDLIAELPCGKTAFYDFFPSNSNESEAIKEILDKNKTIIKRGLRTKWYNGDNATCQVVLYKLIASQEERQAISNNPNIQPDKPTEETRNDFLAALKALKDD